MANTMMILEKDMERIYLITEMCIEDVWIKTICMDMENLYSQMEIYYAGILWIMNSKENYLIFLIIDKKYY